MTNPSLPLNVVTGFLGAGKTTLINRLLRAPELADALVIVNEWGEVGLDHLLYEIDRRRCGADALGLPLLLAARRSRRLPARSVDAPRRRRARALLAHRARDERALRSRRRSCTLCSPIRCWRSAPSLAGVTTLVDAVNGEATLQGPSARRAGKPRSPTASSSPRATSSSRRAARAARAASRGDRGDQSRSPGVRRRGGRIRPRRLSRRCRKPFPPALVETREHSALPTSIRAYAFVEREPIGAPAFARFLAALQALLGPRLLRVKGLAAIAEHPNEPLLIHGAQHVFHAPRRLTAWPAGGRETRIVIIVDGADPRAVDALWRSALRPPQGRHARSRRARGQSAGAATRRPAGLAKRYARRLSFPKARS